MRFVLKLLFGVTIFAVLMWKANPKAVIAILSSIPFDVVGISFIFFMLAWVVAAYKWYVLLPASSYRNLLALSFVGQFYSWIIPGQIAGEFVKGYRLGKGRPDAERLAISVLVDKLAGLIGLLGVATMGLLLSHPQVPKEVSVAVVSLTVLLLACLWSVKVPVIYGIIAALVGKVDKRWPKQKRFTLQTLRVLDGWKYYVARPFRLVYAILLGAVFQLICVAVTMVLAQGLGIKLQFFDWCWVTGLVSVAVLLPISIGGIGVREGAFAGALSLHGIPVEQSVALSLAGFVISLAGVVIGGLLELTRRTVSTT